MTIDSMRENWGALLLAGLIGTGGGGGVATALGGAHLHPEIIAEIREVEYESEIFRLNVAISTMESEGQKNTAAYAVAVNQLTKFNEKLMELK